MELAMHTTLRGQLVELLPLQLEHAPQLLQATADGELWNMTVTVVPGLDTIARYIAAFCRPGAGVTSCVSASSICSGWRGGRGWSDGQVARRH